MHTVRVKAQSSDSNSCHDFRNIHSRNENSSRGDRHISAFDKRESKHRRSNSGSHEVSQSKHDQKDSFSFKHRQHLSTYETDNRFWDRINGKELASDGCKSAHKRNSSTSSRSKPVASNNKEINCPVYRERSSKSAFKQRMEKKSRFFDDLSHDASRKETRKFHISGIAKHTKGMPLPSVKHTGALHMY